MSRPRPLHHKCRYRLSRQGVLLPRLVCGGPGPPSDVIAARRSTFLSRPCPTDIAAEPPFPVRHRRSFVFRLFGFHPCASGRRAPRRSTRIAQENAAGVDSSAAALKNLSRRRRIQILRGGVMKKPGRAGEDDGRGCVRDLLDGAGIFFPECAPRRTGHVPISIRTLGNGVGKGKRHPHC